MPVLRKVIRADYEELAAALSAAVVHVGGRPDALATQGAIRCELLATQEGCLGRP